VAAKLAILNYARAALHREKVPNPSYRNDEPAAKANQKENMGEAPSEPPNHSTQLQFAHRDDGRAPSDGGKIALMMVAKWWAISLTLCPT